MQKELQFVILFGIIGVLLAIYTVYFGLYKDYSKSNMKFIRKIEDYFELKIQFSKDAVNGKLYFKPFEYRLSHIIGDKLVGDYRYLIWLKGGDMEIKKEFYIKRLVNKLFFIPNILLCLIDMIFFTRFLYKYCLDYLVDNNYLWFSFTFSVALLVLFLAPILYICIMELKRKPGANDKKIPGFICSFNDVYSYYDSASNNSANDDRTYGNEYLKKPKEKYISMECEYVDPKDDKKKKYEISNKIKTAKYSIHSKVDLYIRKETGEVYDRYTRPLVKESIKCLVIVFIIVAIYSISSAVGLLNALFCIGIELIETYTL